MAAYVVAGLIGTGSFVRTHTPTYPRFALSYLIEAIAKESRLPVGDTDDNNGFATALLSRFRFAGHFHLAHFDAKPRQ